MCNSSQVWWDVSSTGQARAFEGEIPNPFKVSARSPFLDVPGVSVESIKTDVMHTFNLGVGGDLSSSAIVALCKLNFFPGRSLQSRMDAAYEDFSSWCVLNQKTASTKSFEKKRFHMKSNLGSCLIYFFICAVCGCPAVCGVGPWPAQARNNDYPQGVSRAHDVALFCKWLGAFMAHNSPRTALAPLLQIGRMYVYTRMY